MALLFKAFGLMLGMGMFNFMFMLTPFLLPLLRC